MLLESQNGKVPLIYTFKFKILNLLERYNMLNQQQHEMPALASSQFPNSQTSGIHSVLYDSRLRGRSNTFIGGGGHDNAAILRQEFWPDQQPIPAMYNAHHPPIQAHPTATLQQQRRSLATEFVPSSRNFPGIMPKQQALSTSSSAAQFSPYQQHVYAPTPIRPMRRFNQLINYELYGGNGSGNSGENSFVKERQINNNEVEENKIEAKESSCQQQYSTGKEKIDKNKEKESQQKSEGKTKKAIENKGKGKGGGDNTEKGPLISNTTNKSQNQQRNRSCQSSAPSFQRANNPGPSLSASAPSFSVAAKPKSKKKAKGRWKPTAAGQITNSMGSNDSGPKNDVSTSARAKLTNSSLQRPIGYNLWLN